MSDENELARSMDQFMGSVNEQLKGLHDWKKQTDRLLIHGNGQPSMKEMLRDLRNENKALKHENELLRVSIDDLAALTKGTKKVEKWWQMPWIGELARIALIALIVLLATHTIEIGELIGMIKNG